MTIPDTTGTTWRCKDPRPTSSSAVRVTEATSYYCHVEYLDADGNAVRKGRIQRDPKTGGPRGYSKCEEVTT